MKKILLFSALFSLALALPMSSADANPFRAFKGAKCPRGWRHAPYSMVKRNLSKACRAPNMGRWHIARIAGGGSQDGWGYKCRNRRRDARKLGHSLCVRGVVPRSCRGRLQCWWMNPRRGNKWFTTSSSLRRNYNYAQCWMMNSCGHGGKRSGGGCYKWARCAHGKNYLRPQRPSVRPRPRPIRFVRAFKGARCPRGWRHAPYRWVLRNRSKACRAPGMGRWHIARIAGGGSQDGYGYKCRNRRRDKRKLGSSLCVR